MNHIDTYFNDSVALLCRLIATPSFSREESATADIIGEALDKFGIEFSRKGNNLWARNRYFDPQKPTLLLNSHHDTVRPNKGYTRDPFAATIEGDRLYGLGSNDAGASVVSLISAFRHLYLREDLSYNLILAITAEEEVSGRDGLESIFDELGELSVAIVGEPTGMNLAVAERGLMVLDCIAKGRAGHAARNEGDNAIYRAMQDIEWFRNYRFPRTSPLLGEIKMSVTIISAGSQHNVVPAECSFTVDVRSTDAYTNEQIIEIVRNNISSEVVPRSTRLNSSAIDLNHPIVSAAMEVGCQSFISPTTSDQAILRIPSVKIGVGDSARSHSADEFVLLSEIREGIQKYINILEKVQGL